MQECIVMTIRMTFMIIIIHLKFTRGLLLEFIRLPWLSFSWSFTLPCLFFYYMLPGTLELQVFSISLKYTIKDWSHWKRLSNMVLAKAKYEVNPVTSGELIGLGKLGPTHHQSVADNCTDHRHKRIIQVSHGIFDQSGLSWWMVVTFYCLLFLNGYDRPLHVQAVLSNYIHAELSRSPTHPNKVCFTDLWSLYHVI